MVELNVWQRVWGGAASDARMIISGINSRFNRYIWLWRSGWNWKHQSLFGWQSQRVLGDQALLLLDQNDNAMARQRAKTQIKWQRGRFDRSKRSCSVYTSIRSGIFDAEYGRSGGRCEYHQHIRGEERMITY